MKNPLKVLSALTATAAIRHEPVAVRWRPSLTAAAAAAIVCIGLGYGVAQVTSPDGPARPLVDAGAVVPASVSSAPQPTHVIRFESGVDWRETSGGN